jgi:hypothetical protein
MNYKEIINSFTQHKRQLLDHGLNEQEASALAARLFDITENSTVDLYRQVKQLEDVIPYRFMATNLTINSIQITKSSQTKETNLKMKFSLQFGIHFIEIVLQKKQAFVFLALIILKFRDFERDATGGFSRGDLDDVSYELQDRIQLFEAYPVATDFDNIKRKLNVLSYNFSGILEYSERIRLSVPPTLIFFSAPALKSFEEISKQTRSGFLQKYHLTYLSDK